MSNTKKYWKSVKHLNEAELSKDAQHEFPENMQLDTFLGDSKLAETSTSRRDFLKFLGFSVTAASLAACETPVIKSIPYLNKPEDITPGIANWYASSYYDGSNFANILVKTREGRPIHISTNPFAPNGRINPRINASVLSLYDGARLKGPVAKGKASAWNVVDKEITEHLDKISAAGGNIRILSNTIISPSTNQVIADFRSKYPTTQQVTYDAVSYSALRKANRGVIPFYDFSKAKVIVSLGADFMGGWLNSQEYLAPYAQNRKPENGWMSRHYQFETNMSLAGSNADVRVPVKPSEQGKVALALLNAINGSGAASNTPHNAQVALAARELMANRGNSLVIAGANDTAIQTVVHAINTALGNYGSTIVTESPYNMYQGDDEAVANLITDIKAGNVQALFIYGVNPVYSLPNGADLAAALKKVPLVVSFSDRQDETAAFATYICPDHHYLESWNDYSPKKGEYAIAQPTITPLFNTRPAQESLMRWSGNNTDYLGFIKGKWQKEGMSAGEGIFEDFWNMSVHNGYYSGKKTGMASAPAAADASTAPAARIAAASAAAAALNVAAAPDAPVSAEVVVGEPIASTPAPGATMDVSAAATKINAAKGGQFELALYQKIGMGDGSHANNPWLQELPDPISKITWDNYVTMSPRQMEEPEWGFSLLERGDHEANVVEVTANGRTVKLPVIPQPGQAYGTIGIALGYGRTAAGKAGDNVGQNAYPFVTFSDGAFNYNNLDVKVAPVSGEIHLIAATQTHHTLMGRDTIVRETTLNNYKQNPKSGNEELMLATHEGLRSLNKIDLWREHPVEGVGHRWGMSIDLNTCLGCSACVTACNSENNVPVVGKDEVRRSREMHWLRIDRYYSSDAGSPEKIPLTVTAQKVEESYEAMERPADNPQVAFQPMLCQHCNHAPCETVCPVAATTHSNEGLNQMAYNRCIGTRYCANNCPYKVRRFNWFNYIGNEMFSEVNPAMDDLARMVLNPDVVVRSRGVMEKCTFCVQRIQAGKLEAKKEGRMVNDSDVVTACAAACPTNAIIFGDINDNISHEGQGSLVHQLGKNPRAYHLLEEVGTRPNIYYQTKVRNTDNNLA